MFFENQCMRDITVFCVVIEITIRSIFVRHNALNLHKFYLQTTCLLCFTMIDETFSWVYFHIQPTPNEVC